MKKKIQIIKKRIGVHNSHWKRIHRTHRNQVVEPISRNIQYVARKKKVFEWRSRKKKSLSKCSVWFDGSANHVCHFEVFHWNCDLKKKKKINKIWFSWCGTDQSMLYVNRKLFESHTHTLLTYKTPSTGRAVAHI